MIDDSNDDDDDDNNVDTEGQDNGDVDKSIIIIKIIKTIIKSMISIIMMVIVLMMIVIMIQTRWCKINNLVTWSNHLLLVSSTIVQTSCDY